MSENYQISELNMQGNKAFDRKETVTIDASTVHYRLLNEQICELAASGIRHIIIKNVRGQRYLGARLAYPDLMLQIEGVPGEDLGFNLNGPTLEVFGHTQNAVANTMDSGKIIVHGIGGDALAYGMRGGRLFVRDSVGYRAGIHMKEYRDKVPVVVIGGTAADYLGEYMAGGMIIVLNKDNATEAVVGAADKTFATGIHGGEIYVFNYDVPAYLPGIGARIFSVGRDERRKIEPLIEEFCKDFRLDAQALLARELVKVSPAGSRPFAGSYYPAYPANTGLKPEHAERVSPCEAACPAGVPTGRFLRYLRLGDAEKAIRLLGEVTPFRYSCCGFICPHLCMDSCTRGKVDFSVRTADLAKRYKSDIVVENKVLSREKIAVIGAGPAGLSAAYQLVLRGYKVTVFDQGERPGGKLFQAVSRSRLPLEALEYDLHRIEKCGVKFVLSTKVDNRMLEDMLQDYDYVVVAVGAHRPILPPVRGVEYLYPGLDFLKECNKLEKNMELLNIKPGEKMVVVGGGDAAVDGIEAALELGVDPHDITVIDVKKPSANIRERRKLEKMGVEFRYPVFLKEATESGVFVDNSLGNEEFIPAKTILVFINERPELDFLTETIQTARDGRGFFMQESPHSFRTSHPRISVVGDATGLGLVTANIGKGRQCALEIDAFFGGKEFVPEIRQVLENPHLCSLRALPLQEYDVEIEEEHSRCLHCGICVQCDDCVNACPRQALSREGEEFSVDLSLCGGCGTCEATCLGGVIKMVPR